MDGRMTGPSWRKPLGVLAILGWIMLWAVLIATVPRPSAWPLQALFFAIAGLVWITPLKPVLRWMERGPRG